MHFRFAGQGAIAPLELDDLLHGKARFHQPRAFAMHILGRQRDQMQPGITRDCLTELFGERRVVRRGEQLDETEFQFGQPIRGAARLQRAACVCIGLHIDRRNAEAEPLKPGACRVKVRDEIPDMIEEDLAAPGQLAPRPLHALSTVGQSASSSATIQRSCNAAVRHSAQAGSAIMASI